MQTKLPLVINYTLHSRIFQHFRRMA